jgi:hypothetical protein
MSRRTSWRPEVLGLESRAVPTVVSPLAFGGAGLKAQRADAAGLAMVSPLATSSTNNGLNFNPNPTIDPTTLSPLGLSASRFAARVSGPFALARSYYSDVAKQIVYIGNLAGTPGQMLHGTMIMRVVIPVDSTSPILGVAVLRDLSNATTGNQLVLDLTARATDAQGRPTQFTWNVDGTSAGSYTNAPGQGTLTVTYNSNGHSKSSAGGYTAIFKGAVLPDPTLLNTLYDIPKFN